MKLLTKLFFVLIIICTVLFLVMRSSEVGDSLFTELLTSEREDHNKDDDEDNKVIVIDGFKAIQLEDETIENSGIDSQVLERMTFKPESIAYAEVVDVAPLVALKTEYEATLAEQNIHISELHNYDKILNRAKALHKAKSLSARDLDRSRADRDLKSSQLRAINTKLGSIKYNVKSSWGNTIADYIFDENKRSDFDLIASNKKKLILVSLPKNKTLNHKEQNIFVSNINQRDTATQAVFLDYAKHVNNPLLGESYFYLIESETIRTGMKLFAWFDENSDELEGVFVPDSAVIWYANEAWIYIKQDKSIFVRKSLANALKINNGWLLQDEKLINNKPVVVNGGQTLLSEEFKWAIPDEDDD